jgi:hypothetical protein
VDTKEIALNEDHQVLVNERQTASDLGVEGLQMSALSKVPNVESYGKREKAINSR